MSGTSQRRVDKKLRMYANSYPRRIFSCWVRTVAAFGINCIGLIHEDCGLAHAVSDV